MYLDLTAEFNRGRLRAVVSSGQAVVLHRLAIMSKDGDWILREEAESTSHVLSVLEGCGANYRFGAPLDIRWLAGGWSSHFEFRARGLRVRTDFVTRPPRLSDEDLGELWMRVEDAAVPVVDPRLLAELKKTAREKDYPVIGELARLLETPEGQFLYSRSARDLLDLVEDHPELARELARQRPVLEKLDASREALEAALDHERRELMARDEKRLDAYAAAARGWADLWPDVQREVAALPLTQAHEIIVERVDGVLPREVLT